MFQPEPVIDTAQRFTHEAYPFFTATLTVGLLSMALIQILKDLLPVRRWFQRYWVLQWLRQRRNLIGERVSLPGIQDVESDLVQLATDGDRNSFYNLPIEQLCGQLNSAAQAILENPTGHVALLWHLASKATPPDVEEVINCSARFRQQQPETATEEQKQALTRCVDARNRVAHQVQRAIDALQLSAGNRWKLWIQIFSIALSGIIAVIGISAFGEVHGFWRHVRLTLAVGILGGFLAPIARDLIAAVESARK